MSKTPFFAPPGNLTDFQQHSSYQKWSDWISSQNNQNIKNNVAQCDQDHAGVEDTYPAVKSQYYNPEVTTLQNAQDTAVTWPGFPLRIASKYGAGDVGKFKEAEFPYKVSDSPFLQKFHPGDGFKDVLMRVQDEYLEWFPTIVNGKLVRVDFSCEGPEYWSNMYDWEPDTLVALYQKYVSPDVQLTDLQWKDPENNKIGYNPFNKWNTTHGIMHLNCPPNSLAAEINLAAFATVLHGDENGQQITDTNELIECAQYGNPSRHSDPNIGATVNGVCGNGEMVTCTNPVGLYVQSYNLSKWTRNNARIPMDEQKQIVTVVRGKAAAEELGSSGRILRLSFSVPEKLGYSLSDISVAGIPLQWGGQIAADGGIIMSLSATHAFGNVGKQPLQKCYEQICPSTKLEENAKFAENAKLAVKATVRRFH